MTFEASPWRAVLAAGVVLALGYGGVLVAGWVRTPVQPLFGADDPVNPGVLIAGGSFLAGDLEEPGPGQGRGGPFSTADEPVHPVTLPTFRIQQHEVTNSEFRRFDPGHPFAPGQELLPAVHITFKRALDYAFWLGGTLPTEDQWEFAARGADSRVYPWGDTPPDCAVAHFADCDADHALPVLGRATGASPEGVHDLAGNVWEWVMPDWFDPYRMPVNEDSRRLRGGSFADDPFFLRASNRSTRHPEGFHDDNIGFRVAWAVEPGR